MSIKIGFEETSYNLNGENVLHIVVNTGVAASSKKQFSFKVTLSSGTGKYTHIWENVLLPNGQSTLTLPFVVPLEWANDFTWLNFDGTNGELSVKLETKYTLYILTDKFEANYIDYSHSLNVTVDENILPDVGQITYQAIDKIVPESWNKLIKGLSQIKISVPNAVGAYGSNITSYYFASGTRQEKNFASLFLEEAGNVSISVTVMDSRGRIATKDLLLYVDDYYPPSFTQISSHRCNEKGELQEEGTHFLSKGVLYGSNLGGNNPISLTVAWKKVVDNDYGVAVQLNTLQNNILVANLEKGASYDVKYTISDAFHNIDVFDYLSSTVYLLHFLKGGTGIAVGKAAEQGELFDIALNTKVRRDLTVGGGLSVIGALDIAGVDVAQVLKSLQKPVQSAFLLNYNVFPHDYVEQNKIVRCGKQVTFSLKAMYMVEPMPMVGQSLVVGTIPAGFYSENFIPHLSGMLNGESPCVIEISQTGVVSVVISQQWQQQVWITGTGVILDNE